MITLKQVEDTLGKLARNEPVDPRTLKAVSTSLASRLAALKAPDASLDQLIIKAAEPVRSKLSRSDRCSAPVVQPLRDAHVTALETAKADPARFDTALKALLSDKAVTARVLRDIAEAYTGTPVTNRTTRAEAERLLRQGFARRQWQAEAYRRLDELNAGT